MKHWIAMLGALICLLTLSMAARAQDQAKNSNDKQVAHLRIDITLTEFDGDKKISTLPYTLYAAAPPQQGPSSLRMGVRVPVNSGSGGYTYMDVGTDIDCFARSFEQGSYALHFNVRRSSIYTAAIGGGPADQSIHAQPQTPVVRNFNSGFDISLRDGETGEGTSATDPLNGHVLKISVTLHVLK